MHFCLQSGRAPPSMQCNEAPSSMHPLSERAARWRGPFTVNWPWQSLIESRFLSQLPSLPPRPQEFLPPPPLLHLSFTSSDWHVQSMCFLFPAWEVSVPPFLLCPSCLSPLSAFLSHSLPSLPQQDEDICHALLNPVYVPFSFAPCIPLFPVCLSVFLSVLRRMKTSVAHDCFLSHFFSLWFWHHALFYAQTKGMFLILSLKEQMIRFWFLVWLKCIQDYHLNTNEHAKFRNNWSHIPYMAFW